MSEEDIESPYCEVCGTCGYIGCCGIRNFIEEHIEGKTNCKNEGIIINELVNLCDYRDEVFEENKRLHSIIKEVRDNLENSIKSINEKLRSNKEPFEVIDGRIQYINDYRVVRLKAFRTKCKELLELLDKENICTD